MKAYVIALIACGSVAAVVLVWYCGGRKRKSHQLPVTTNNAPEALDVEKAAVTSTSAHRDWGIRGWGGGHRDWGIRSWGGGGMSSWGVAGGIIGLGGRDGI
ncbi:hypothetical protein P3S67_018694 [Capsicum chacoense]